MSPFALMALQSTWIMGAFAWLAAQHVVPRITPEAAGTVITPLLWINVFRVVPLVLFAPGQVAGGVPTEARAVIAYGDLVAAVFAAFALALHLRRARSARAGTWLFLAVGTLDVVAGLTFAMRAELYRYELGASWFVVVLFVPLIVVSQGLLALCLLRGRT